MTPQGGILIIHRRALVRDALTEILSDTGFDIRAAVPDLASLPPCKALGTLSVVILEADHDLSPTMEAIARIRARRPETKIVILADTGLHREVLNDLFRMGATGFITLDASRESLALYVQLVANGMIGFAAPLMLDQAPESPVAHEPPETYSLSARERQILALVAEGRSNKAIARDLQITEWTVKAHLKSILRKIGVQNRTQAAVWALRHNITAAPSSMNGPALFPSE